MRGKRGQEGVSSIGTIAAIILVGVVVVILILGATKGFDYIFNKIPLLPGQSLEVVAQSCKIANDKKLERDYCIEFKKIKIDGKTNYLNCMDIRVIPKDTKVTCKGEDLVNECNILFASLKEGESVWLNNILIKKGDKGEENGKLVSLKTTGEEGVWISCGNLFSS